MDIKTQVTLWVEKKFGKLITKDVNDQIKKENSAFNVDSYVNNLLDKLFKGNDGENLKETFSEYLFPDVDSDNSVEKENNSQDSFELETQEFQTLSTEEIIKNLTNNSVEVRINSLKALELSAEDLVNQSNWPSIKKTLQKMLEFKTDVRIHNLVLKVFQKFLTSSNKPHLVCEGFMALTEVISYQIELINLENENVSFEEIYDLKNDKWLYKKISSSPKKSSGGRPRKQEKVVDPDLLIKLMWLLIECQRQAPAKWIRFHQKRFSEIIFSFIHLLSSTSVLENEKLSGLELLSVLNPTASWCLHWCHTVTGRNLLCSALRKYKSFFVQIIEIILTYIKTKKVNQSHSVREIDSTRTENLHPKPFKKDSSIAYAKQNKIEEEIERSKWVRSAPSVPHENSKKPEISSEWFIKSIPRRIVSQATFSHSIFLVTYLIQFRSGRALFPVQTSAKKRLLTVQDLSLSMTDYLENFDYYEWDQNNNSFTSAYKVKLLDILQTLKSVKTNIHSSRLSAERPKPSDYKRFHFQT